MSSDVAAPAGEVSTSWPVLPVHERRVLGVLVEKAKTTPDIYPLSMNALVTGCNQKSNREPVMNLSDHQVEETLISAQAKGLVVRIQGGRVERWRHTLYETWNVDKVELAVLAELLLRGAQTEGELRSRASRMEPIADLESLRGVLRQLAGRRLVVYLTPEGRRGTTVTHGFHAPEELERLRGKHAGDAGDEEPVSVASPTGPTSSSRSDLEMRLDHAHAEIDALREVVANLEGNVGALTEQVQQIKQALGL